MIRIRGRVGDWPVDLEIELDAADWAGLEQILPEVQTISSPAVKTPTAVPVDTLWQAAQDLLRQAGEISGPELLGQLEALAGNVQAAKRLVVRLRHCVQVEVKNGADAPVYRWIG